ncbi:hypothetical protein ACE193_20850 [Bernardetia sp. OM2101]|uniref:hypothetical protein n=1 Tax=Bernardetia sp. OM2101 TaxID=3344876 RepID=UPI0035D0B0C4
MPQNTSSNKFSSIIGFLLLAGIVGFTVFINFFTEKPVEEIKEEVDIVEVEEPEFSILDSIDLANLWELRYFQAEGHTYENRQKTFMSINEIKGILNHNPLGGANYNEASDSVKQLLEKIYNSSSKKEFVVNYGILAFKHSDFDKNNDKIIFENFKAIPSDLSRSDSIKLKEIGNIILNYQIESIFTESKAGDFTKIELKDGRQLFLIKQNAKIKTEYSKKLIERAEFINDSTKVIYPY